MTDTNSNSAPPTPEPWRMTTEDSTRIAQRLYETNRLFAITPVVETAVALGIVCDPREHGEGKCAKIVHDHCWCGGDPGCSGDAVTPLLQRDVPRPMFDEMSTEPFGAQMECIRAYDAARDIEPPKGDGGSKLAERLQNHATEVARRTWPYEDTISVNLMREAAAALRVSEAQGITFADSIAEWFDGFERLEMDGHAIAQKIRGLARASKASPT